MRCLHSILQFLLQHMFKWCLSGLNAVNSSIYSPNKTRVTTGVSIVRNNLLSNVPGCVQYLSLKSVRNGSNAHTVTHNAPSALCALHTPLRGVA